MSYVKDFFHFFSAWNVWHVLFHDFVWLDWILCLASLVLIGLGIAKGFGVFFGKLIQLLILIFTVLLLGTPLADWATRQLTFAKAGFWQPFFFLLISFLMILIFRKVSGIQSKKGFVQFHPFWDRVVGAAVGFFMALLIMSFMAQFVLLLPAKKLHKVFEKKESRYGVILRDFVPQVVDGALAPVRAMVNRKVGRA